MRYEKWGQRMVENKRNIPFKVTSATVNENDDEEHRVEVGDNTGSSDNSAPCQAHGPVSNVIGFARVCPAATSEQAVAEAVYFSVVP